MADARWYVGVNELIAILTQSWLIASVLASRASGCHLDSLTLCGFLYK